MKNKIIPIILLLTMISTISAFGISSPYWKGNPLTMEKGETKIINLNLQNIVGEEDIIIKANIIEGAEIASLKQDTFVLKAGTSDTIIPLEITIPKEISSKENKTIKIDFEKVSDKTKGVSMGTGMSIYFDVITIDERIKESNDSILIVIGIILLIILWIILKRREKIK